MTNPGDGDRFQEPIVLDARDLRSRAEAYASLRGPAGDRYFFVQKGPPGQGTLEMRHDPPAPDEGIVFQLNASAQQPGRPKVIDATITAEGGGAAVDLTKYDAVFWTEAAVEKFVFPYLASKSMWSAAHQLIELSRTWYGFVPDQDPRGRGEEPVPFAIGHIPDSDFETVTTEPGHDLDLLFNDGSVKSLAQVIAERKAETP
jgi:hypothetical protein